jgi:hypothetical protein
MVNWVHELLQINQLGPPDGEPSGNNTTPTKAGFGRLMSPCHSAQAPWKGGIVPSRGLMQINF